MASASKVLASLLVLPAAALVLYGGGALRSCGRRSRVEARTTHPVPEETLGVFLGEGRGFHLALGPAHPEKARSRHDAEVLSRSFSLPGASLASLHVFRFLGEPAEFDPKEAVVEALDGGGAAVRLRPLVSFSEPSQPRDALVFRALAGPGGRETLAPPTALSLLLVLPEGSDLGRFHSVRVPSLGATLSPVRVEPRSWRGFLSAPGKDFFLARAPRNGG